jgi:serine/threonine protein kinase/DNA-binding SARP family transcriptional activator/predicted ATPase
MGISLDPYLPTRRRNTINFVIKILPNRQDFLFLPYAIIKFDLPVLVSKLEYVLKYVGFMAKLEISLFGPFQVLLNRAPVTQFESVKVRALLAYLAAEYERSHTRDSLAALLWPDWPQQSAMRNLRNALADLRKNIADRDAQPPYLLISRESIQLNPQADAWVDVTQFESEAGNLQSSISNLQSAISLYRGSFLDGFLLPDNAPFEEWLLAKREYFSQQMLKTLSQLAEWGSAQEDYEQVESYARRQIELEPWREQAHQQLMRAFSLKGERVQALAQFESLKKALQRELKVEPSADTVALYQQIRDGRLLARTPILAGQDNPDKLGKYTLLELLGKGRFGVVYKASDPIGRIVAVKVLKPGWSDDSAMVARFRREAQAAGSLFHPRIATILDFNETGNTRFLVVRYIEGPSLERLLTEKGRLDWPAALRVVQEISEALDYAHQRGFVHRDVKPANILVSPSEGAVLSDFGLVRTIQTSQITSDGAVVGSPSYIAPEIWRGEAATPASDMYSLGCVLFEMVTGQVLFEGESTAEIMTKHLLRGPVLPDTWPEEMPIFLESVLSKALSQDPLDRYATAGEFSLALAQSAGDFGPFAPQPTIQVQEAEHPVGKPVVHGKTLSSQAALARPVPAFLDEKTRERFQAKPFVAREDELETLNRYLAQMLNGRTQVVFLAGSAGQGKTSLIQEFVMQVLRAESNLLVSQGICNAYSGQGDAYLPFRDVIGILTGEVEDPYLAGVISREHARRLWEAMPGNIQVLLKHGKDLLETLVPGERLLSRAESAFQQDNRWTRELEQTVQKEKTSSTTLGQSHLFEQCTNVLRAIAEAHPLLITLDDLQWADAASASLLFHVGRRLQSSRVMIVCAYRPEEVTQGAGGEPHPLEKILSEFKRQFGDTHINLSQSEEKKGRYFIDAFLATEPNQLGERFRQILFQHTRGHPLFTIELLRAMQERGDLVQQAGVWVEGLALDWESLPPRVEAVIEERVSRLEAALRDILTVASVEGEDFTAQVVARVQQVDERKLIIQLSEELEKHHRLVGEEGVRLAGKQRLYRFRFYHGLFQQYIYRSLGAIERGVLHEEVASVLEALYAGHEAEIAPQLAYHYKLSGNREKAVTYLTLAGDQAQARYANQEAVEFYTQGLELTEENEGEARYWLLLGRDKVNLILGRQEQRKADLAALEALAVGLGHTSKQAEIAIRCANYEDAISNYQNAIDASIQIIQSARENGDIASEAQGFLIYGSALWHKGEYDTAREKLLTALELAETAHIQLSKANILFVLGIVDYEQNNFQRAIMYYHRCLAIYQETGDRVGVGHILNSLGTDNVALGNLSVAEEYFEQAWSIFRETGDRRGEAFIYTCLAQLYVQQANFSKVVDYYERGLAIFRDFGERINESIVLNNLGEAACFQGDYVKGFAYYQQTLDLCRQIESRSGIVYALNGVADSLFGLGRLDEAGSYFRQAIDLGEELGMRDNAMDARGGLARVLMAQGELDMAYQWVSEIQAYLEAGHELRTEVTPFRVYWTCYQVLKAALDPRARELLETTYQLLCKQAGDIKDGIVQRAFLENIPWNRAIVAEALGEGISDR